MLLTGQFRNIDNELFTVKILTDGDSSTTRTIGENGLYFGDDPVMITTDCDSSFEHIIRKSCEINLVCSDYIGDALYANNSRSIVLNIKKEPSQEVVFAGYVEPNTFNQPFAKPLEEFTINATDALSTLQYYKYKNCTLNNYDQLKTTVSSATFYDIIEGMFDDFITELDIDGDVEATLIYDCSKGLEYGEERTIFNDLAISESYIMGEEFDDCMTQEEVLQQIMQYLNLHIIQEGFNFWIFDWNTLRNKRNSWWDIINTRSVRLDTPSTITFTRAMHGKDDTNITVDDVYNQVSVKCELETDDVVIESPLEDKDLSSLFSNKQLVCREYWSDIKNKDNINKKDLIPLKKMLAGQYLTKEESEKAHCVEWYAQAVNNNKWQIHPNNGTGDITDIYTQQDGTYINQWDVCKYVKDNRLTPCLFKYGKVERKTDAMDNEPTGKVSMSNYLYISVNGNMNDSNTNALPNPTQLAEHSPMIEYTGTQSGSTYSPPDDETTNYIVFSGKLTLQALQGETGLYNDMYHDALTMGDDSFYMFYVNYNVDFWTNERYPDYPGRYYTRKFFTMTNPSDPVDETAYLTTSTSLQPPAECQLKQLKYEYSEHNYSENADLVSKLPVLECELIIGNKRLIETDVDQWGNSVFQWVNIGEEPTFVYEDDGQTYSITTFTLGINPKLNDFIIGDEYNLQNTITVAMNLNTEGTAIPIKKSDQLSGAVIFRILGPINTTWNRITRRHPTWFRHTEWKDNNKIVLAHTGNIVLKNFEAKIVSDNAGTNVVGDTKDLIYMSDETDKFINKNDETTFKFITQLTSAEAVAKGVKQGINLNAVQNANEGVPLLTIYNATTQETAKAEEHYVDQYYTEYSSPKLILEATMHDDSNIDWRYKYYSGVLDRNFIIQAMEKNLKYNNATITFKEV